MGKSKRQRQAELREARRACARSAPQQTDTGGQTSGIRPATAEARLSQKEKELLKVTAELQALKATYHQERERDRNVIQDLRSEGVNQLAKYAAVREELRLSKRRTQKARRQLGAITDAAAALEQRLEAASMVAGGSFQQDMEEDLDDAADDASGGSADVGGSEETSSQEGDGDQDGSDNGVPRDDDLISEDGSVDDLSDPATKNRKDSARRSARKATIRRICGRYRRRRRRSLGSSKDSPATFHRKEHDRKEKFLKRRRYRLEQFFQMYFGKDWEADLKAVRTATADELAGNSVDPWDATSPVLMLNKFFNEHMELFQAALDQRKVGQQAEMAAMQTVREHWEVQALKVLVHCNLTKAAYQYLINLLSNVWVDDDFARVTLPCGTEMCLFPSKRYVFKHQAAMMEDMGLASDSISAGVDVKTALTKRLQYLFSKGLLDRGRAQLQVQVLIDATGIFPSKRINGTLVVLKPVYDDKDTEVEGDQVNSPHNCVIVCFYLRDDCLCYLNEHAVRVRDQITELMEEGIDIDGQHYDLQMPVGGDQKLLNSISNLCGCSAECPCLYCEATLAELHLTKKDWQKKGGAEAEKSQAG